MKKKQLFWRVILILSLVCCVCCLGFVVWYLYQDYAAQRRYEEMQKAVETTTESSEFTGETDGEEAELPDDIFLDMENPIDFTKLSEINPDSYT